MALKRDLGAVGVFSMASGAMISSGLFVLPTIAFARVGPGVFLCYLLASVLVLPSVLTKAELMTAMPKAGGTYFHLDRSFGPGMGAVGGVANWAALAFKSAFALLGIGAFAASVWPEGAVSPWVMKGIACVFCLVFAGINMLGARHAGWLQGALVAGLLIVLVLFAVGGLRAADTLSFRPLLPYGWNALLAGTAMVFVSYGGVTKVANLAEEVRDPRRDLIRGMFAAYVVVSLLYVLVVFVAVGLLPVTADGWTLTPLQQAGRVLWGRPGQVVLALAAMSAFLTTGNAGILTASRTVMAMGQDRLLPGRLAKVTRRGTPANAILFTSAFMVVVMLALDLELFVKAASAMMIMLFGLEMVALLLMRESRIPTYAPTWRSPFYPWVQFAGLLCYAFLLVELGSAALAISGLILGAALAWYWFYVGADVLRESALVRLAARIARADFGEHDLEAELSQLARERARVVEDRFDGLIRECTIIDLQDSVSREDVFRIIRDNLAPTTRCSPDELLELLQRREILASSVIRPGLAIPHLILEGLSPFQILLMRSRAGVKFSDAELPVHAIFVLAASAEERNFYLRALVAVAEIAQDAEFDAKWLSAGRVEALREVVLAAERRRDAELGEERQSEG